MLALRKLTLLRILPNFVINRMAGSFLYFAYGSNLLRERIQLKNPSAVFKAVAKLEGYRLDFDCKGRRWQGAAATLTEDPSEHCWGIVWKLANGDLENLDRQEGISTGVYKPIEVEVTTQSGEKLTCRSYYLLKRGDPDRRPSPQYMDVIIRGANQNGLPPEYIDKLRNIEHNGYQGTVYIYEEITVKRDRY